MSQQKERSSTMFDNTLIRTVCVKLMQAQPRYFRFLVKMRNRFGENTVREINFLFIRTVFFWS